MHVAIIPDGNRRYAVRNRINFEKSYSKSIEQCSVIIPEFFSLGVDEISIFGFSKENWKRDKKEVDILLGLFRKWAMDYIEDESKRIDAKVKFIGDLKEFDPELRDLLCEIEHITEEKQEKTLNICLNYSAEYEADRAHRFLSRGLISNFREGLLIKTDVDLLLRTSGEKRCSGFLPFQCRYAELFFEKKLWNELTKKDVQNIIARFKKRNRRFGT